MKLENPTLEQRRALIRFFLLACPGKEFDPSSACLHFYGRFGIWEHHIEYARALKELQQEGRAKLLGRGFMGLFRYRILEGENDE